MDFAYEKLLKPFKQAIKDHFPNGRVLNISGMLGIMADLRKYPAVFPVSADEEQENYLQSSFSNGPFEIIFGDIPAGRQLPFDGDQKFRDAAHELIYRYSKLLTQDGVGVFVLYKGVFNTNSDFDFVAALEAEGFFITAYVKLPEELFESISALKPNLVIIRRQQMEVRTAKLESIIEVEGLVAEILQPDQPEIVSRKLGAPGVAFRGFEILELHDRIAQITSRYKDFQSQKMVDLVAVQNRGKKNEQFPNEDNAFFIKLLGSNATIFTRCEELDGRLDNYVQFVLKPDVSNQFIKVFFQSDLGQLLLDTVMTQGMFGRLDVKRFLELQIPVPSTQTQIQINDTSKRFDTIVAEIEKLKNQLSLTPDSMSLRAKIDSILDITQSLTAEDRVRTLILQGESKRLEFKQTFQLCLRENSPQKYVEDSCLKTIVGFLNTDGGTLLIGVEDSGLITGIDAERAKLHKDSNDRYLLRLKDKISVRLGKQFFKYIDTVPIEADGKNIIEVVCSPSDEEVFLDGKDFYIRTSPSTDKLEGRELSSYLKKRFD